MDIAYEYCIWDVCDGDSNRHLHTSYMLYMNVVYGYIVQTLTAQRLYMYIHMYVCI